MMMVRKINRKAAAVALVIDRHRATILVDGGSSVEAGGKISSALEHELFAHIPALSVINVRVNGSERESIVHPAGHHH